MKYIISMLEKTQGKMLKTVKQQRMGKMVRKCSGGGLD
jgi:hypothetical protein